MGYKIGADIGGTFTDIILVNERGTRFQVTKVLTTPEQPDDAVLAGIRKATGQARTEGQAIAHVVHGTTLLTNALIERKGAKTALITTRGFRDAIEIGREHRYDMYDLYMRRPEPLAPRYLRFEVDERILEDGSVRTPLDEKQLQSIIAKLQHEAVEAVAVCLLHAYRNSTHERRIAEILAQALPRVALTLASDLVPEIREYERTSTTLANVYVKRIAARYLERLQHRLAEEADLAGQLFVMQYNGGACEVASAMRYPIRLVESGPAAGALAAAYYGAHLGHNDLLSFDMGGTTAKAALVVDGQPVITRQFEVDRQYRFKKGSGLPIKTPAIDMIEIGTGGGSMAYVDAMQRLRVGPQSAGAHPGPACYALGGDEPTITDADLVLGYLDPEFFLGGSLALDLAAARAAIQDKIAAPLGLDVLSAAWGMHQLANEDMASAARIHTIERGQDISRFPIFSFGGAGPIHAFGVARILGSPRVIAPLGAGVMSAVGFLTAPLSFDLVRSLPATLDATDWKRVNQLFKDMEAEGRAALERTVPPAEVRLARFADMRYRKQGYELRVPLPEGALDAKYSEAIRANFEDLYQSIYGHAVPNTPVEALSWRLVVSGPKPDLTLPKQASGAGAATAAIKNRRPAYQPEVKDFVEMPVYDRYHLQAGMTLTGPAIIEENESTVVVSGPARIQVDTMNNLIIDL